MDIISKHLLNFVDIPQPSLSPLLLARTLPPFCEGLDGAEKYQAEPEVHKDAQVHFAQRVACGRRKVRHHQEIHQVPCQNGNQGLNEIHSRF